MANAPIIDRFISYFSPRKGFERAKFRALEGVYLSKRRYEAAGNGKRTSGWNAPGTGPNAEVVPSLPKLRSRSRDLVRNNPYAKRAVEVISSNVVGYGIVPQQKNKKFDEAWKEWAESASCDVEGLNNFYGMQALIMREIVEAGEVLVRRVYAPSSDGMTVPMRLHVIESDMVNDTVSKNIANGNVIKYGIEFDSRGRRVAYHLYEEHPGELNYVGANYKTVRVPASDILHIYRMDRAGQMRGVPWGASVLLKLRDFDDYDDAQLLRQKIAACFAGFLVDKDMAETTTESDTGLEHITPGLIAKLPPGKEITFGNPPAVGLEYAPYAAVNLRAVATGYGVTYEALTQDYSQVNFSSGRMGWLEFHRNISQWQWHMLIPNFCQPVWQWFIEAAELSGVASSKRVVPITWTPPRREMIDPVKETDAKISSIRGGLITLSEAIREQGNDPEKQLEEMKKDNDLLDKLGLKLDSDSRQQKQVTQSAPAPDAQNNNS